MDIKHIGLSTSAFGYGMGNTGKGTERRNPQPWTLEQFVDFSAAHGMGGIETPLARFVPGLEPERVKQLHAALSERNMFFIMDAEGALDPEEIATLIPITKAFGSPVIRIKSSAILGCARKKLGKPWGEHVTHCIEVLRDLAPLLRSNGLRIAIENHQDLDSNDLAQIVQGVGTDVVGVNFDIGNAFATCEDPSAFAEKLGSSIINIHLKDYKIFRSEDGFRLVRCALGSGAVDFRTILPLLVKNAPDAKMVIELGALEARDIAWLTPSFWEEIQPRDTRETIAFFRELEGHTLRESGDSWQTPWESGASPADIVSYEVSELETSIAYLSTL